MSAPRAVAKTRKRSNRKERIERKKERAGAGPFTEVIFNPNVFTFAFFAFYAVTLFFDLQPFTEPARMPAM
jgi:hypothetical protein